MKRYKVEVEVKIKWTVPVDAHDEADAAQQVECMDLDEIEAQGDFKELSGVETTDIEEVIAE